ncbi:MAG: antibiotic biosynthesis monooxygenase [Pseudomonadota bacterium]
MTVAVIFEVVPAEGQREAYLEAAASMRGLAEGIDGFVSVERFESLTHPGKLLSLSIWRDEAAVAAWRRLAEHRAMQKKGRALYFEGYRLRVASVIRDYGMEARDEAPADSRESHGV